MIILLSLPQALAVHMAPGQRLHFPVSLAVSVAMAM